MLQQVNYRSDALRRNEFYADLRHSFFFFPPPANFC